MENTPGAICENLHKKAIAAGGFRIKMVKNVEGVFLFLDMDISPC